MVEQAHAEQQGPSIEDAEIIVAGGRGLGEPEKFALAEELARALGGAVAATRAVVDAGWYPYSAQVGQTGKTVSPKLYVALGISGAIQHKVGMQGSNVIVAINKDPNAPIFEYSDLGVVGDLHEIVPKLTELVRSSQVVSVRPSEFPPPWSSSDAIAAPTDPVDERIEVGFLIVGAGPAGLAAAIRLGQLIEEDPATAERLGEVPVAVLEKGKAPGAHLLSGAVVNPRGLQRLFKGRKRIDEMPFYGRGARRVGPVPDEAPRAFASRRRRRWSTTGTTSRRSRGSGAGSPSEAEALGVDDPARDVGGAAARRRRPCARRAHRRSRPRARRGGARELRAGLGHRRRASRSSPKGRRAT